MCVCALLTGLPDLHRQLGQFALKHRLLLLRHVDLLHRLGLLLLLRLGGLLALQRLDLQGDAVLGFGWEGEGVDKVVGSGKRRRTGREEERSGKGL